MTAKGPLSGVKVVEFGAIGPVPHCAMLLSDMGADIVRIDRARYQRYADPVVDRGRAAIELDLKTDAGIAAARAAISQADVVIEGYRPGAMERLGLGPDWALAENPRLVYARMTGWGQNGPLADHAGHDIMYIALAGALDEIGHPDRPPVPPLNLVGDYGGGSLYLAYGIALALFERTRSGLGQVIDAAIVDGTASLMATFAGLRDLIGRGRAGNHLGGRSPTYRTYRCKDGKHVAIGAIEAEFWTAMADALGLSAQERARATDDWDALAARLEEIFLTATQSEWCERFGGRNDCLAPVLSLEDAAEHPHMRARGIYRTIDGVQHPAPAPRLSRTPGAIGTAGCSAIERLVAWGVDVSSLCTGDTGNDHDCC